MMKNLLTIAAIGVFATLGGGVALAGDNQPDHFAIEAQVQRPDHFAINVPVQKKTLHTIQVSSNTDTAHHVTRH